MTQRDGLERLMATRGHANHSLIRYFVGADGQRRQLAPFHTSKGAAS
jgi:hypothetical protein